MAGGLQGPGRVERPRAHQVQRCVRHRVRRGVPRRAQDDHPGEGTSITAAEDAAWEKYSRITAGDHEPEFETRGYRNGAGCCTHCGLFASGVFDLAEIGSVCTVCGVGTYRESIGEDLYCRERAPDRAQIKAMRAQLRAAGKDTGLGQLGEMFEALLDEEDDADSA